MSDEFILRVYPDGTIEIVCRPLFQPLFRFKGSTELCGRALALFFESVKQ